MNQITNPHFLYLHSSIATQNQVYDYVQRCIRLLEDFLNEKLNKEIIVNTVTKHDGTPLNHSYVWCKSVEVVNLLLNRTKEGVDRVEEQEDPDHDTTVAENDLLEFFLRPTPLEYSWVDLVEEEEILIARTVKRTVQRPMKPYVDFGTVMLTDDQLKKYPQVKDIHIKFFHLKIPMKTGMSTHKLFALHVPKDLSEAQIRKVFEPYVSEKKSIHDKKNYPLINIDKKANPTCVTVSYQPASFDAIFAILMNKRVIFSEKCSLNFELYRSNC